MVSRKSPLPDNVAYSATLEAKLDRLSQKLDAHIGAGGGGVRVGCPVCLTCSKHIEKHGALESLVEAHTELLENLQRRTLEILETLDRLVKDNSEAKHRFTPTKTTPSSKLGQQPETREPKKVTAAPTETSVVSVKIPDVCLDPGIPKQQRNKQPAITSSKKGAEPRDRGASVVGPLSTGDGTSADPSKGKTESHLLPALLTPVNQDSKCTVAVGKVDLHSMQLLASQQGARQADDALPPSKTKDSSVAVTPRVSSAERSRPAEEPERAVIWAGLGPTPGHKSPCPGGGSNTPAVKATRQQALQGACKLAVPMATPESPALRHVLSCPESLQRLRDAGPEAAGPSLDPASKCQTQQKRGPNPSPGPGPDTGIQIRVFPATQDVACVAAAGLVAQTCQKMIDDLPPRPALFPHRCVSPSLTPVSDDFLIHTWEVLGSGRFGKVYRCKERRSGLNLAAKVINTCNAKEKEMALNEVQVMNQLNHGNILQLYQAMETRNQVVLVLEHVEGGELFDRIVDESTPLTEVDAMVFVKQICEGLHYMHQMYVIHLDLKPENILCVDRTSHQVKIIDFGLARRYKPGEKLRVNFGTPEFLAPEVVNFDFVSFSTDMWTFGVVAYMLVSGMSPFLGDDDSQTLSNVLAATWYFDDEAFEHVSAEARDFIGNLLIREKGGRMSAAQCLKHPWLNNISEKAKNHNMVLKSQVLLRKYMAKKLWKKNYIAVAAANRLKKIGSSGSLTSLGV